MKGLTFDVLWRALAPHAPAPWAEYRFTTARRYRFDYAWPAERVAVEVDGGQWQPYGGRHARDADREKHNLATAEGWRVLHFSTQQLLDEPETCVALTLQTLQL